MKTGLLIYIEEFIKFGVTGGLGAVTNLTIFFLGADLCNFPEIPVSVFCFLAAVTQGYVINHRWSFKKYTAQEPLSFKTWLKFTAGSLFGLAVNITVMKLIIYHYQLPFKFIAQGGGILAGMFVNFFVSKLLIFRKKENPHEG